MGPPCSRPASSADGGSSRSSPTTPASAPGTPRSEQQLEPPAKKPRVSKKATEQTPLTPLQKAKDMCTKLLKKKSDASNLGLTLQSVAYADALSAEMTLFAKKFEFLGHKSFFASATIHTWASGGLHVQCMVFDLHETCVYTSICMIAMRNELLRDLYLKIQGMINDQKNEENYIYVYLYIYIYNYT